MKQLLLVIIFIFGVLVCSAQHFFRFKADFSIKLKTHTGVQQLTMGKVYYDMTYQKLIHKVKFPKNETWVTKDTFMYQFINEKQVSKQVIPSIARFSVFHIALSGKLPDFGLKNSSFTISKVEKDGGLVITTWQPPANYADIVGKIMISNKDKKLHGIIFFSPDDKILSKQFFNKYVNVNGFNFPSEILQINYFNGKESYEMSTYKNIKINELKEEYIYNYPINN